MSDRKSRGERTILTDRRGAERTGTCAVATLTFRGDVIDGVLEDISTTGARIRTADVSLEIPEASWLTLEFVCFRRAAREEMRALARIVWRTTYHDGARQVRVFGMCFEDPIDLRDVGFSRPAPDRRQRPRG